MIALSLTPHSTCPEVPDEVPKNSRNQSHSAAFAVTACSSRLLTPPPLRVNGVSKASVERRRRRMKKEREGVGAGACGEWVWKHETERDCFGVEVTGK